MYQGFSSFWKGTSALTCAAAAAHRGLVRDHEAVSSNLATRTKGQVLIGLAFFYCRSLSVARNCASSAILSSYSQKDLFLTTLQEVPYD
jgi:hypothetical protein